MPAPPRNPDELVITGELVETLGDMFSAALGGVCGRPGALELSPRTGSMDSCGNKGDDGNNRECDASQAERQTSEDLQRRAVALGAVHKAIGVLVVRHEENGVDEPQYEEPGCKPRQYATQTPWPPGTERRHGDECCDGGHDEKDGVEHAPPR